MVDVVKWCSLFCNGSPAVGELEIPIMDAEGNLQEWAPIPVCDECGHKAELRQSLERLPEDDEEVLATGSRDWNASNE